MARKRELPSTLQRSPKKAQETFAKTLDAAEGTYDGDERAAHRVAYGSLKHSFEKVGDHWEPKEGGRKGPSDEQASRSGAAKRDRPIDTAEGVDANASKKHLYEVAQRLDVSGRSKMDKGELVDAIEKANRRATANARS
ncbi:MAG TPA: ChaB family protein [Acidimicrobiales bacterium]|nr:ChaB family protein [Acidimicrobiales bacterium]